MSKPTIRPYREIINTTGQHLPHLQNSKKHPPTIQTYTAKMASPEDPNEGISYFPIPQFKFSSGAIQDAKIAYRSYNPSAAKTVLIPTCMGGRINDTPTFTSGALKGYHVIVVALFGNGESSSPSNDPDFPSDYSLRYEDCVRAQYALVTQHLGIRELEAVVGFSMGGQAAYYWAVMYGTGENSFVKNAVVICSSARTSGHNYAFLEGPISALEMSWDYAGGRYRRNNVKPVQGLRAFGRAYAGWLTSPEWFRQELWTKWGADSLKGWLYPPDGEAPFESWDAEDLLVLARMWQNGDVGSVHPSGDYRKALESVTARVLVMPSETDQYFDVRDGEEEVKYLKNGIFAPIQTIWGHVAGGGGNEEDTKWVDAKIQEFLKGK
jgi:homoserine acetyltransferase